MRFLLFNDLDSICTQGQSRRLAVVMGNGEHWVQGEDGRGLWRGHSKKSARE